MKPLLPLLFLLFSGFQVKSQQRGALELPFGLTFGLTPEQVTDVMKKLDVEEEKALLAEYRFFSHVPVGDRFATVNAIFNEKTLLLESVIEAFEESEDPLGAFDTLRAGLEEKYGKADSRERFDHEKSTAQEDWKFADGVLTLSLAKSGVSLIFDKALPKKK